MKFTKMHGIGNDYVYINCFEEQIENPGELSRRISDRHFGIGSDGLVLIKPSDRADFFMEMYNSDGSQSEMCGNAIRCVAKYVYEYGLTDKTSIAVDTLAGIKYLELTLEGGTVSLVKVNMGRPVLVPAQIPALYDGERCVSQPITVDDREYEVTCVSMGNPHAVVYMEDVEKLKLEEIGPLFEHHKKFPARINAEFARVLDRRTIQMRVWERGSGETLACGTGACAVTVASILNGLTEDEVAVRLLGGELKIQWEGKDSPVYMTGGATIVFDGEIKDPAAG